MSEKNLQARDVDIAVRRVAGIIDPIALRTELRELATELDHSWGETRITRHNSEGERIGDDHRLNAAATALAMEAATTLHRAFERWKRHNTATPAPTAECVPELVPCRFAWCDIGHTKRDAELDAEMGEFHREPGIDRQEPGVLRTDHVYENDTVSLSIAETVDWEIPGEDAPAFFAKLRAAVDEAEQRFSEFQKKVTE